MDVHGIESNTYVATRMDAASGINPSALTVQPTNLVNGRQTASASLESDRLDHGGGAQVQQNSGVTGDKEFEQIFDEIIQHFQKVLGNNKTGTNNFTDKRGQDKPGQDGLAQPEGQAKQADTKNPASGKGRSSGR
jgi:hypothetical protein